MLKHAALILILSLFICFPAKAATLTEQEDVTIGAGVQERSEDLLVTLTSTTPGTTFNENQTINYQINYGSETYSTERLTIEATWSLGTVEGVGSTVNVLNYVTGSATNAYGSTPPVIDLSNRKITWTINTFPGRTTDQIVSFSLRTNSSYQGVENVNFSVTGRSYTRSVTSSDSTVNQTYVFSGLIPPEPEPELSDSDSDDPNDKHDGPGSSSGSSGDTTPGVVTDTSPSIRYIDINYISATEASIQTFVSNTTQVRISYGTSPYALNSSLTSFVKSGLSTINLKNLKPNTVYYFKLYAIGSNGKVLSTDLYTFKTAQISAIPKIDKTNLVITSRKSFLYVYSVTNPTATSIVVPINALYEFRFKLNENIPVKDITVLLRRQNDLNYLYISDIAKVGANEFVGRVTTPSKPGLYEMYIRVNDYNGNLIEEKLVDVYAVTPFGVYDKDTVKPLDDALVTLYIYNSDTGQFEIIRNQTIIDLNPSKTDALGLLPVSLPIGLYKAKVSRLGYEDQEVTFTISTNPKDGYPTVYMQKSGFSIGGLLSYYGDSSVDVLGAFISFINNLALSDKFYNFVLLLTITSSIISILAFISYINSIPLYLLPIFILDRIKHLLLGLGFKENITGKVLDFVTHDPIAYASVYIMDASVNSISNHLVTDALGHFYFSKNNVIKNYKISVAKTGYELSPMYEFTSEVMDKPLILHIKKRDYTFSFQDSFKYFVRSIFTMLYEFLLVCILGFSLLLIFSYEGNHSYIFLLVSFINLLSWIYFVKKRRIKKY